MLRLKIASPCEASWSSMAERRDGRYCERCAKPVFDFARATEARALAVAAVFGRDGELCAHARVDRDGFARFEAEPPDAREALPKRSGLAFVPAAAAALAFAPACTTRTVYVERVASADAAPRADRVVVAAPIGAPQPEKPAHELASPPRESDGDGDGDGVPNAADACPDEAAATRNGCPPRDGDGDGVPDATDACPTVPGPTQGGCPAPPSHKVDTVDGTWGMAPALRFRRGSAVVLASASPFLDELAALLRENPDAGALEITGRAARGERRGLARARALAVTDALVRRGVDADRLAAHTAEVTLDEPTDGEAELEVGTFAVIDASRSASVGPNVTFRASRA